MRLPACSAEVRIKNRRARADGARSGARTVPWGPPRPTATMLNVRSRRLGRSPRVSRPPRRPLRRGRGGHDTCGGLAHRSNPSIDRAFPRRAGRGRGGRGRFVPGAYRGLERGGRGELGGEGGGEHGYLRVTKCPTSAKASSAGSSAGSPERKGRWSTGSTRGV